MPGGEPAVPGSEPAVPAESGGRSPSGLPADDDLSLDMLMAALRADSTDVAIYAQVLTTSLSEAMPPGCVSVERQRSAGFGQVQVPHDRHTRREPLGVSPALVVENRIPRNQARDFGIGPLVHVLARGLGQLLEKFGV